MAIGIDDQLALIKAVVDAIKARTDLIPDQPAEVGSIMNLPEVDSTGVESLTVEKAIEVILAAIAGKSLVETVSSTVKRVTFYGRDGVTALVSVEVDSSTLGLRTSSEIPS